MLDDIVLDANVLAHADDPRQADRQTYCRDLLVTLKESTTRICVDEGFNLTESQNRSHIGREYLEHLRFGMLGQAIIAHLAATHRVKMVSRNVGTAALRHIVQRVGSPQDRTYIRVATNSTSRVLASHDYADIPQKIRNQLLACINVRILAANEAHPLLV